MATKILTVDDSKTMRAIVRKQIVSLGHEALEAADGSEGLIVAAAEKPDLILLDLMMPVMDGFEFLARLRQREDWQAIPVVVVTAKSLSAEDHSHLDGYVERILEKGAYDREALLREVRNSALSHQPPRNPARM